MLAIPSQLHSISWRQAGRGGLILGVALLACALCYLRNHFDEVTLELEAEVERGGRIEIYFNERWDDPRSQAISSGERRIYSFTGLPDRLSMIRIDPTDVAHSRVRIYDVSLKRKKHLLRRFGPAEIRNWVNTQLDMATDAPADVYEARSNDRDPIMRIPGPINVPPSPVISHLFDLSSSAKDRERFNLNVMAGLIILLIVPGSFRRTLLYIYLPLALLLLVQVEGAILLPLQPILGSTLSSDQAVGWSNYAGYPKQAEFYTLLFAVVCTIAVTTLVAYMLRRRYAARLLIDAPATPQAFRGARILCGLALLFFLMMHAAVRLPEYRSLIDYLHHTKHSFGYDDQNFFTWRYCMYSGWQSLRDFWFPYSDFGRLDGFWVTGSGREFLHRFFLQGIFALCVYLLSGRSRLFTAAMFAGGFLASGGPLALDGESRYGLALNLVLLALVCRQYDWSRQSAIGLGAFAGYSLIYEPHQIVYASLALASVWGLDFLWPRPNQNRAMLLGGLGVTSATFAIWAVVRIALLAVEGRLSGEIEFIKQSGAMMAYGSVRSEILLWFHLLPTPESMLFCGMLILIGYGAFLRVFTRDGIWNQLGAICLAIGLLSAMVMSKQVARPHVASQLFFYVQVGGMFMLQRILLSARLRERLVIYFGLVYFIGLAGGPRIWAQSFLEAKARIRHVPAWLHGAADGDEIERTYSSYFFDENRYGDEQSIIHRLKQLLAERPVADEPSAALYVLGDEPFLYAALKTKPPYYITFYNDSPIDAQKRTVRWLEDRRPSYIVWRPSRKDFDDVPNIVRVPLLFEAVVDAYEPLERVGDYHILRRRPADKPIDMQYFGETLSTTFAAGALPAHSRLRKLPRCSDGDGDGDAAQQKGCAEVLHVYIAEPRPEAHATVHLQVAAQDFTITLLEEKGVRDYYLPLSRVWFYRAAKRLGLRPQEALHGTSDEAIEVVNLADADRILF